MGEEASGTGQAVGTGIARSLGTEPGDGAWGWNLVKVSAGDGVVDFELGWVGLRNVLANIGIP